MDKKEAKERIEKLKKLIEKYRYSYHVLDRSLVPDSVNDSLKHELQELESRFPEFVTSDSPTQRVGGKPLQAFSKYRHKKPMLSMVDVFSFSELEEWERRLAKVNGRAGFDYFCMVKLDGLALELEYQDGLLKVASTRGDGNVGEDVTAQVKTIESVPLSLRALHSKAKSFANHPVVVRGEAFIKKSVFEELNSRFVKEGKAKMVNPRNAAAGSIRQLDPKITASRRLSFYAWDIFAVGADFKTQAEKMKVLKDLGFPTEPNSRKIANLSGAKRFYSEAGKKRNSLDYWIDGVVVKVDSERLFNKLGVVGKAPRGIVAWKFPAEEATTVVREIVVQVGRTGVLTPVAILKPVVLAGTTVSRATLHNAKEIKRKDIRLGDTVVVRKAGDIIPEVVKPLKELRQKGAKKFEMVANCPVCDSSVKHVGDLDFCVNKRCFTQTKRRIIHFVSKNALNIDGLGPKIIEQLLDEGIIKDETDLFELKEGDLKPLERFAAKSAKNLVAAIAKSRKVDLERFIYALGIRHVGAAAAADLAYHFGSFQKLSLASEAEILKIYGAGDELARSVVNYFKDEHNKLKLKKILKYLKLKNPQKAEQKLAGKIFVITGSLESMTREEAEQVIRSLGGRASSSVSKETDYVVVGKSPGSKYDRAKKLKIKIISEAEFKKML